MADSDGQQAHSAEPVPRMVPGAVMEREPGLGQRPGDRTGKSLVTETVLTAILVPVILNTATGARSIGHNAAIAVGSTVALLGLFASPISGASMNPARTLGPDIVGNDYTEW